MKEKTIQITHASNSSYARSLAAKLAFNGWHTFSVITILLLASLIFSSYVNFLFDIMYVLTGVYIFFSLFAYFYYLIIYSSAVGGYNNGKYTFSFNTKVYKEKTRLGEITIVRDSIKRIKFNKHFVVVHLSLKRKFALPTSKKLVDYIQKYYSDKLR